MGCHSDRKPGIVQFTEIEPRPIGQRWISDEETTDIEDAPVTFIFNKIESLDAVISQLQKLRDIMSEEGKYEWIDSGRIVEKNQS
ncbi:MAG: hypothetical protein RR651_04885 [Lysinibacillus sp.]